MRILATVVATVGVTGLLACGQPRGSSAPDPAKAVLEAYVRAWNRHDSAAFDTLLAPDGVHEDLSQGFTGRGSAQVKEFMRELIRLEPDFRWELTSVFTGGQIVAAEWTWTATYTGPSPTGPVVGRHISGRGASVAVIDGGRIKRFTDYYDAASYFPPLPAASTRP